MVLAGITGSVACAGAAGHQVSEMPVFATPKNNLIVEPTDIPAELELDAAILEAEDMTGTGDDKTDAEKTEAIEDERDDSPREDPVDE